MFKETWHIIFLMIPSSKFPWKVKSFPYIFIFILLSCIDFSLPEVFYILMLCFVKSISYWFFLNSIFIHYFVLPCSRVFLLYFFCPFFILGEDDSLVTDITVVLIVIFFLENLTCSMKWNFVSIIRYRIFYESFHACFSITFCLSVWLYFI